MGAQQHLEDRSLPTPVLGLFAAGSSPTLELYTLFPKRRRLSVAGSHDGCVVPPAAEYWLLGNTSGKNIFELMSFLQSSYKHLLGHCGSRMLA